MTAMKAVLRMLCAVLVAAVVQPAAAQNPVQVKDINPGTGIYDSSPEQLVYLDGLVYFFASANNVDGRHLFRSNGSPAGTFPITGPGAPSPQIMLGTVNGKVIFLGSSAATGTELFAAGPGSATAIEITPTSLGTGFGEGFLRASTAGGYLYFTAEPDPGSPTTGLELWRTDGTTANMVKEIVAGTGSPNIQGLTAFNGIVYFSADDGVNGSELWRSDGTDAGTYMVKDIRSGALGSNPSAFAVYNGALYFSANDGVSGTELWKTDGTAAGTVLVADIVPGAGNSIPSQLKAVNGILFMTAFTAATGTELFKSDGTSAGTVIVKDIRSGLTSTDISTLTESNGLLFFLALVPGIGNELWRSDGTEAGTFLVKDILPGSQSGLPAHPSHANGALYFSAVDVAGGPRQLWRSDGTTAGTIRLSSLGGMGVNIDRIRPLLATPIGVFFAASDAADNDELWLYRLTDAQDFSRDARPDLVWSQTSSGATYIWRMSGTTLQGDQFLGQIDPSWKIAGMGDFNSDGHSDVIWRNTSSGAAFVWHLVDGVYASDAPLFTIDPQWAIIGVADFNADGKPDLLMRHVTSGLAFAWFYNGVTPIGDQFLFSIDPEWKVEAVGHFSGDGLPDLLFRNTSSGLGFVWYTDWDGTTLSLAGSSAPMFTIDPAWEVVQVADWNMDGQSDLVFRNTGSGVVFVWYLTGTTMGGSDFIVQVDTSWEIVPRR